MKLTDIAIESSYFKGKYSFPVIKWDVLNVVDGTTILIRFVSKNSEWRQGIRIQGDLDTL